MVALCLCKLSQESARYSDYYAIHSLCTQYVVVCLCDLPEAGAHEGPHGLLPEAITHEN